MGRECVCCARSFFAPLHRCCISTAALRDSPGGQYFLRIGQLYRCLERCKLFASGRGRECVAKFTCSKSFCLLSSVSTSFSILPPLTFLLPFFLRLPFVALLPPSSCSFLLPQVPEGDLSEFCDGHYEKVRGGEGVEGG